ncbi:c-type cytochrome [Sandaracinus amylolyticus]|uniref:Putative diheme cytochrome c-553 n=1 Tax=Sandaracinus amylolyticus TaxID=927083 RepID=A0A0F6SG82_9BACT|nr:c-type cytochrome [Sandaracinus amylolyticus]AKF08239.1 Putative diheme cytochrome c-553 [Sandaracinus amylolyticus]
MRRKIVIALASLLALVIVAGAALVVRASQPVSAPYPEVSADRSEAGIARGRVLFEGTCAQCHRAPGATRVAGAPLAEIPAFLGEFHSRNLTRHPTAGIGGFEDREIARLLRYGVTRDGHAVVMPTYGFSDEDLAAVLGFLRSDDPVFEADATETPPSRPSLVGRVLVRAGLPDPATRPARGMRAPPRAPTAEYGRYLAHDVFDCAGCHTPGYDPDKASGDDLLRGGFELVGADGAAVRSPNLTAHASGLAAWTSADLGRALRDGLKPDGTAVRPPMPLFRGLGDDEVEALFVYLRSVPALDGEVPATQPVRTPRPGARAPEQLFVELGCPGCHAPGARYHAQLEQARGEDPEALARWIQHPEALQPGTPMPTYGALLSDADALALARWVSEGAARTQ